MQQQQLVGGFLESERTERKRRHVNCWVFTNRYNTDDGGPGVILRNMLQKQEN